ncbi:MAG TPA: hypothetical protein PLE32_12315, partial [Haliscomenobacter sp.]|nr:hypothetical protein [Haliscomenobacter sp.]
GALGDDGSGYSNPGHWEMRNEAMTNQYHSLYRIFLLVIPALVYTCGRRHETITLHRFDYSLKK